MSRSKKNLKGVYLRQSYISMDVWERAYRYAVNIAVKGLILHRFRINYRSFYIFKVNRIKSKTRVVGKKSWRSRETLLAQTELGKGALEIHFCVQRALMAYSRCARADHSAWKVRISKINASPRYIRRVPISNVVVWYCRIFYFT